PPEALLRINNPPGKVRRALVAAWLRGDNEKTARVSARQSPRRKWRCDVGTIHRDPDARNNNVRPLGGVHTLEGTWLPPELLREHGRFLAAALPWVARGWNVIPAAGASKVPAVTYKEWYAPDSPRITEADLYRWAAQHRDA